MATSNVEKREQGAICLVPSNCPFQPRCRPTSGPGRGASIVVKAVHLLLDVLLRVVLEARACLPGALSTTATEHSVAFTPRQSNLTEGSPSPLLTSSTQQPRSANALRSLQEPQPTSSLGSQPIQQRIQAWSARKKTLKNQKAPLWRREATPPLGGSLLCLAVICWLALRSALWVTCLCLLMVTCRPAELEHGYETTTKESEEMLWSLE